MSEHGSPAAGHCQSIRVTSSAWQMMLPGTGSPCSGVLDAVGGTAIATLIAAAKEFGGDDVTLTQEGFVGPAMSDPLDESLVFFRITETDPSRAPHNVDEVRDQVVGDLRRQADYQRLLAKLDDLEQVAKSNGLLTVALDNETELRRMSRVALANPSQGACRSDPTQRRARAGAQMKGVVVARAFDDVQRVFQ